MAMDALRNLTTNIRDWLKRLGDLSGQIDQRQAELAAVAAAEVKGADTKSLRNKGSTETLKPKDDGSAHIGEPEDTPVGDAIPEETPVTPPTETQNAAPTPGSPPSPAAIKRSRDAIVAARARVKKRSTSMLKEDAAPAYRTRSMIIVYYDSYVQSFFDDLVRFVSSSRNLMRKAKMAAKVAQSKKLAEMDVHGDGENNGEEKLEELPSLRYMSTQRFGHLMARPGFGPPGADQKPDIYGNLDKGFDFVQSMCEHGAHQFLRDGNCNDEITKVQKRLREVLEMAAKEAERIEREEPELAKETGELGKVRTKRPISMRREIGTGDETIIEAREGATKLGAATPGEIKADEPMDASKPLEVDPNIEADEGIEVEMELPKLEYRSTRALRNRGP